MKVAFQQEDIQLLSSILQEQLRIEIPSVPVLEVRCAVKTEQLMILTQHPQEVSVDTDKIFAILEESLQWQSQYHNEMIQLYVRVSGEKLPYTKKLITVKAKEVPEFPELQLPETRDEQDLEQSLEDNSSSNNGNNNGSTQEVIFPPLEIPEISTSITEDIISNHDHPISSIIEDETPDRSFGAFKDDETLNNSDNGLTDEHISDTIPNSDTSVDSDTILEEYNNSFNSNVQFSNDQLLLDELNDQDLDDQDNHQNQDFGSLTSLLDDQLLDDQLLDDQLLDDQEQDLEINDLSLEAEEEVFDPFDNAEEIEKSKKLPLQLPPIPVIIGLVLVLISIFGGGTFFMIRACIIGQCPELQTAEQLKTESQKLLSQATSEQELIPLQKSINQVISDLKSIPQFSPRYQEAQQLTNNFSQKSTQINSVIQALQTASQAETSSQKPATSLDELRNRQTLWRNAITPLESVKSSPELSQIANAKLPTYKNKLQAINQQLLTEEGWQKKLATSQTIATTALKRQAEAKSVSDWQRVELGWKQAVNTLQSIPQNSTAHTEAQTLLKNYQQQFTLARNISGREQRAVQNYQQAMRFASQAKNHENNNNWQSAVAAWDQAIRTAQLVSSESLQHSQAQALIAQYSQASAQAQQKFQLYGNLDQTRADLSNTCVNQTRFCTFSIEDGTIIVRLTPEYDRRLLNGSPELQIHFSTVQQALGVISDNSNLPIYLYNSQGQERYMKNPL
ncbi:MAG: hypothetical protein F6K62_07320 [Sphaerospermopsis sp. SIO1G2]|nr:hypothetical protein [Sphaerospermopsis sp. SIO1G1]NET70769.1 hypothetical protein [Sphaerospermopsis sp. SIO1G2]